MDWTAGYKSDIEYTAGFFREQSPVFLNFVSILNGYEPVPLDKPFTYCELGFGRGITVNLLAASNPQGQFYATDFMPSHVAGARELANAAGLDNLTLLENSFAELAEGKVQGLPQFDFITMQGVYTWVNAENRHHIVQFINRYLKPGGMVFVSYNALPGWSASLPLQRLLVEHADLHPDQSDIQLKQATAFIARLHAAQANTFRFNPVLGMRLETLKTANPRYLIHEYMHHHWQPLYHADVARDFNLAKMNYVGSADLSLAFPTLYLSTAQQELIHSVSDPIFRETLKDFVLDTLFRKDVYVRGARKMSPARQAEWLHNIGMTLIVPRDKASLTMTLATGNIEAEANSYTAVLDALQKHPCTLAELTSLPALQGKSLLDVAQIAAILVESKQAAVYFSHNKSSNANPAHRMNRAIAGYTRYGDEYQNLASPLIGGGVLTNYVERVVYGLIHASSQEQDSAPLSHKALQIFKNQDRPVLKDGKPLSSDEESLSELNLQIKEILAGKLPMWQQLMMLGESRLS